MIRRQIGLVALLSGALVGGCAGDRGVFPDATASPAQDSAGPYDASGRAGDATTTRRESGVYSGCFERFDQRGCALLARQVRAVRGRHHRGKIKSVPISGGGSFLRTTMMNGDPATGLTAGFFGGLAGGALTLISNAKR